MTKRILIAGAGVAALEAALALRALAEERMDVELLGPEPHFWYRALSVAEPFELGEAHRYELGELAELAGATFTLGALEGVDADRHVAQTSVGDIAYDVLIVAVGAIPTPAVGGALTFRGPADSERLRGLLDEIERGEVKRPAFVVPSGAVWSLPVYELALMTAARAADRELHGVEVVLVTPEEEPLQIFGPAGSAAVAEMLEARGIEVHTGTYVEGFVDGELQLVPEGKIAADRVVALPRLRGPRLGGLPQTVEGFVPIDAHGRVRGLEDVYAAGDITTFPVKQGGIATQLADTAAQAIAESVGVDVHPEPFRPVLRGLLLTGGKPSYLRRELAEAGLADAAGPEPLWWPPAKIVGRHLAPFLAGFAGIESPPEPTSRPGMVHVDLDLLAAESPPRIPSQDLEGVGETVRDAMSADPIVVAPEDTLGEVAEKMRAGEVGSAAVSDYGRLIGILTSRDLLRAFAGRAHPSEARVREWMTAEPVAVPASAPVELAIGLMNEYGIHHLPVVEGERPVGMLGYRQALRVARGRGVGLGF